jgi:hypothetical protein
MVASSSISSGSSGSASADEKINHLTLSGQTCWRKIQKMHFTQEYCYIKKRMVLSGSAPQELSN